MRGWGRKATEKYDKKLEDDKLFKEIGDQLDPSNINYSQWQRTGKSSQDVGSIHPLVLDRPSSEFTVSIGGVPSNTQQRIGVSVISTQHKHGSKRNLKKSSTTVVKPGQKIETEQTKLLQLRVAARKKTLEEYKKRQAELLLDNLKLRDVIETDEGQSHEQVKKLLRKYEKFRGGIATLNDQFLQQLADAKQDLEQSISKAEADIAGLQTQVEQIETKLQASQGELHILVNYKDKEYPVKSLRIAELKKELEQLEVSNQEDQSELQHIVDKEIAKFRREQEINKKGITERATEGAMAEMHPSLREMAMQNLVMKREIEFHTKELENLQDINKQLDGQVKELLKDPKTDIRQQMFPEFYPSREKCTPDMDVVLDIPKQEWLPI